MIPSGDLAACGLPKPSMVRLAKLAALHRQLVIKRIGSMPEPVSAVFWRNYGSCFSGSDRIANSFLPSVPSGLIRG
jgi:hypothetical protein